MTQTLVHLVYIHGFQGNDTSFQTFPTDLQRHLSASIPPYLNIKIQSSLYPTYKSRKPIAFATQNFLAWLTTQPPGPVILMAHSMGGLLAADAATDAFNTGSPRMRRILGVVAFDVPYLGMHPHVVVSGIASLFPDNDADKTTEADMNQHADVKIVDEQVTDDWEAFKRKGDAERARSRSPLPSPRPSDASSPPPGRTTPLLDKTLSFVSTHANGKLATWLKKHTKDPFAAGKRFVVEYFQFGSCMFDPSGLKERYRRLVVWPGGMWVNYWSSVPHAATQPTEEGDASVARVEPMESDTPPLPSPDTAISTPPALPSAVPTDTEALAQTAEAHEKEMEALAQTAEAHEKETQKREKEARKREKAARKRAAKEHHFIVLPSGFGEVLGGLDKWEKVVVRGVADEVAAHCGLFIPTQNLEYERFVERVGTRVLAPRAGGRALRRRSSTPRGPRAARRADGAEDVPPVPVAEAPVLYARCGQARGVQYTLLRSLCANARLVCSAWTSARTRKSTVPTRRSVVPVAAVCASLLVALLVPMMPSATPTRSATRKRRRSRVSLSTSGRCSSAGAAP
ncbi:hypothetical protein GGX14DRAFT_457179 [Mycena pura]|uniref:AB hydrolase-1 domain-containing protein n=1 Tax=Mycena pura TaxID=153505 RepID=A0AAD6V953_9AGAR|nr:hypothetical protein GGX14DRAFT_457179 [Mycena pura]